MLLEGVAQLVGAVAEVGVHGNSTVLRIRLHHKHKALPLLHRPAEFAQAVGRAHVV